MEQIRLGMGRGPVPALRKAKSSGRISQILIYKRFQTGFRFPRLSVLWKDTEDTLTGRPMSNRTENSGRARVTR